MLADAEIDVQLVEDSRPPFSEGKPPVAVIITNYNMPERADALVNYLGKSAWPFDLFLVDNGSDQKKPAEWTSVRLDKNVQTTNGWLAGVAASLTTGIDYLAYAFLITSAEFTESSGDPLASMAQLLMDDPNAVGAHPALTLDSTTAWDHLFARGGEEPRRTWMIDNIFSLYRRAWWEEVGGFDPRLTYGWGVDLETCLKARRQGRSLWIDERCHVKKVTDIGYRMGRMNMTAEQRRRRASIQMATILGEKYGPDWEDKMRNEAVDLQWR